MPMRVNVRELEAFVRICADLRVDRLVLRPLNDSPGVTLKWEKKPAGNSRPVLHFVVPSQAGDEIEIGAEQF